MYLLRGILNKLIKQSVIKAIVNINNLRTLESYFLIYFFNLLRDIYYLEVLFTFINS